MSTSTNELNQLIKKAERKGAVVSVEWDSDADIFEGRKIHDTITVIGLKGCGPYPMSPIAAAERLRELV